MLSCHTLRSCSPLKKVLNKLADGYQDYYNTYKMHTIVKCHRGAGQLSDNSDNTPRKEKPVVDPSVEVQQDTDSVDTDDFEGLVHNNPNTLHAITRTLDDICHCIHVEERKPKESLHCIEQKLQQLSISVNASVPPEPLRTYESIIQTLYVQPKNKQTSHHYYRMYQCSLDKILHY